MENHPVASPSYAAAKGWAVKGAVRRQEVGKPKCPRSSSTACSQASGVTFGHVIWPPAAAPKGSVVGHVGVYVHDTLLWAPGLLCLCHGSSMWVKSSFSLTFVLYLDYFITKPSPTQGSKPWSLYPVIFIAFKGYPHPTKPSWPAWDLQYLLYV